MPETAERVKCDAFGCDETHPVHHENEGEPGFTHGRWLGWVYLNINRPDLRRGYLRFCGVRCLDHWLYQTITARNGIHPDDRHYYTKDRFTRGLEDKKGLAQVFDIGGDAS